MKKKIVFLTLCLTLLLGMTMQAQAADDTAGFVERLYATCLDRTSDKEGLNYWIGLLTTGQKTAAEVVADFYGSEEYAQKNASDAEFAESLYYTMMNRVSDKEGINYWLSLLATGVSRNYIISGFVGSAEFTGICAQYGVNRGAITLTEDRDQNISITKFVQRLYSTCLGRTADAGGLNYWCELVNSGQVSGAKLVTSFYESPEYLAQANSDEAFLESLYYTIMGRGSDAGGLAYWLDIMGSVSERAYVVSGFIQSEEFALLCGDYGIATGTSNATYIEPVYETQRVWVVDTAAYSVDYPIYETIGYGVCNQCGYELAIYSQEDADEFQKHILEHGRNGEGSGYHTESRDVQVDVETKYYEEVGHYESKQVLVSGGYYIYN